MIRLFDVTDKTFQTNGDRVIIPTRAIVHKEDNGSFFISLETDLSYVDDLTEGRVIVANTPQGNQAFRINNVEKTKHKLTTTAKHVFYDSMNYLIEDSYVYQMDCNSALDHLNSATSDVSPFTTISDIANINSYRCVRTSLYDAIKTVVERWGGHLVRDNWSIGVNENIGQDNGVTVRYAKNLKEITCTENWDLVVTKLLPTGYDGIMLNALDESADIYVYSETEYDIPYTKTVHFDQDIDQDNYRDEETGEIDETAYKQALIDDLRQQAQQYVTTNSIPQVNYTLKANMEKITDVGDTVEVIDERLGINILTNVIAFDYDCILEKFIEVEFGNFTPQLSGLMTTITNNINETVQENNNIIRVALGEELETATAQIRSVLGNSYVIYEGDKILVVDKLPKEQATNVIMINNGGIGFSQTGINGTFSTAFTIDGTLITSNIEVINFTADLIKGGTLKLGSNLNQLGILELYDEANTLIAEMNKNGLKMYGADGSYVLMNNDVGFAGYDRNNNKIYWVAKDEFHMKKSVIEEEITLCNKMRFIPIEVYNGNTLVNDGIGLVSTLGGA